MTKPFCSTESQIVLENNHGYSWGQGPIPHHRPDPINLFDINGKHIGYSWNYGDSVELDFNIQYLILLIRSFKIDELEEYLAGKEIEVNFIDMRGEVDYTFNIPAGLHSKLKLNTDENNLIKKNTYTCTLVLVDPEDSSRLSLLVEPYKIYVK